MSVRPGQVRERVTCGHERGVVVEKTLYAVRLNVGEDGPFTEEEIEAVYPRIFADVSPEELPDAPACPSLAAPERSVLVARLHRALKMDEGDMREAPSAPSPASSLDHASTTG